MGQCPGSVYCDFLWDCQNRKTQKPELHSAPSFIPCSLKEVILYLYIIQAHSDI